MTAPNYSAADYLAALQALLPRGRVWPREGGTIQTKTLSGLVRSYERSNARANDLLSDAFPATAYELLKEWESTLALPDQLIGVNKTVQGRRNRVVSKLTGLGGQSISYMIAYALSLGYVITITQYAPARIGQLRAGQLCRGPDWAHAWQVNAALNTIIRFRSGESGSGEPLVLWGNQLLEYELNKVAPAHTVIIFSYS